MWKAKDILDGKSYRLALIQSKNGSRKFVLQEGSVALESSSEVFYTQLVANELLVAGNLNKISDSVKLVDGTRFFVDAHGVWLTQEEMIALMNDAEDDEVQWLNGMPPNLAPK